VDISNARGGHSVHLFLEDSLPTITYICAKIVRAHGGDKLAQEVVELAALDVSVAWQD